MTYISVRRDQARPGERDQTGRDAGHAGDRDEPARPSALRDRAAPRRARPGRRRARRRRRPAPARPRTGPGIANASTPKTIAQPPRTSSIHQLRSQVVRPWLLHLPVGWLEHPVAGRDRPWSARRSDLHIALIHPRAGAGVAAKLVRAAVLAPRIASSRDVAPASARTGGGDDRRRPATDAAPTAARRHRGGRRAAGRPGRRPASRSTAAEPAAPRRRLLLPLLGRDPS